MADDATVASSEPAQDDEKRPAGVASNAVYDRVGDEIKLAAHIGVRRGMNAQDIIRQIAADHGVRLNVGELRLLLAARRVQE